jgi:oxygen-dependent protoporphyrinogen oxidase
MNALVLGGGIAGLAHAHQLRKSGHSVTVIEESDRAGGAIRTEKINGHLVEFGPNTVLPTAELISLIRETGLEPDMQLADAKSPRYILYRGKLHSVPMGPASLLTSSLLGMSGKLRLLREPFVPARHDMRDETLADFSTRRLGAQVTQRLISPFVSGVWAGEARSLSAESAFPKLVRWEKEHGSLFKGMLRREKVIGVPKGLISFKDGLEMLPFTLGRLLGDSLRLNEKVVNIDRTTAGDKWVVGTTHGVYTTDKVISSLPAYAMAPLCHVWAPALSQALADIPYVPLTVVHLSVSKEAVGHSLRGFGYLVAPLEEAPILGCLFSSSLFPGRAPDGKALLTVFIKGKADDLLLESAKLFVRANLSITEPPEIIASRFYAKAIPQYTMGHRERLAVIMKAEKEWPGLIFIGNYLEGISVGETVRQSFQKSF